jgi:hypothetical protein
MSYVIHQEKIEGFTIKIIQDDDNFSDPVKNWDLVGRQVYWHRRYSLGHEQPKCSLEEWLENKVGELYEDWKKKKSHNQTYLSYLWAKFEEKNLVLPVYAYEHGGITIKAKSKRIGWDSFDSFQLGFIYASHEKILQEFGNKKLTKNVLEKAEKCLIGEVEAYDDYITGNVWGYKIEDENGDELDSCWGFVGDYKYALEEAKSIIPHLVKKRDAETKLLDKRMLNQPV